MWFLFLMGGYFDLHKTFKWDFAQGKREVLHSAICLAFNKPATLFCPLQPELLSSPCSWHMQPSLTGPAGCDEAVCITQVHSCPGCGALLPTFAFVGLSCKVLTLSIAARAGTCLPGDTDSQSPLSASPRTKTKGNQVKVAFGCRFHPGPPFWHPSSAH